MRYSKLHKIISGFLVWILCAMLLLPMLPATAFADGQSGSCGSNLTWSLNAGTLTISGSGDMTDFPESSMAPWYNQRDEILRLELPGGLTHIGNLAFFECANLLSVTIPDSVVSIGSYAFMECNGLEFLSLGTGLRSIGEGAFVECSSLQSLTLPGSLNSIGKEAFYRCESIPSVVVPGSVTSIGMLAFGYCKSLVSADIRANINIIPEFLFYECGRLSNVSLPSTASSMGDSVFQGCDQLNTVHYDGNDLSTEQIQTEVEKNVPDFGNNGIVTDTKPTGVSSTTITQTDDTGRTTGESISVVQGENINLSAKVETDGGDSNVNVTVTVQGEADWDAAQMFVESTLNENDNDASAVGSKDTANLNIYISDGNEVDSGFLNAMSNRDVNVTVTTQNGSIWRLNGTQMKTETLTGNYDLRYNLSSGTVELCELLAAQTSFMLQFQKALELNVETLIRVGTAWSNQNATLFQLTEAGPVKIQTVVVDRDGYAHFYLSSVNETTQYAIGMNLVEEAGNAVIPDEMLSDYGKPVRYEPMQYEITGRTSSWNMGLGKVMAILAVVMVSTMVVVGFVIYFMNKQRLKNGYVPDWEDDDE